jgi:uncharacterized protein YneF (UPF0154 family)
MYLYVLLIVVVFLLGLVVVVTLSKTNWKRELTNRPENAESLSRNRVSGGEDD